MLIYNEIEPTHPSGWDVTKSPTELIYTYEAAKPKPPCPLSFNPEFTIEYTENPDEFLITAPDAECHLCNSVEEVEAKRAEMIVLTEQLVEFSYLTSELGTLDDIPFNGGTLFEMFKTAGSLKLFVVNLNSITLGFDHDDPHSTFYVDKFRTNLERARWNYNSETGNSHRNPPEITQTP